MADNVSCMCMPARTARSASSSCATGAPNSATMPSPRILSTTPPKEAMSVARRSKQPSTRCFTSSGSRSSAKRVKPTMSANNTVTIRRSSSPFICGEPQDAQNLAPSGTSLLQDEQITRISLLHMLARPFRESIVLWEDSVSDAPVPTVDDGIESVKYRRRGDLGIEHPGANGVVVLSYPRGSNRCRRGQRCSSSLLEPWPYGLPVCLKRRLPP